MSSWTCHTVWQAVDALHRAGATDAEIDGGYTVNGWLHWAHPQPAPLDDRGQVAIPGINSAGELRHKLSSTHSVGWRDLGRFSLNDWIGPSGDVNALAKP